VEISNSVLDNNSARAKGGGICSLSSTTVTNCEFNNNTVAGSAPRNLGGGYYGESRISHIGGCTFNGNTSDYGGAIAFRNCADGTTVDLCTVIENTGNGAGGGVFFDGLYSETHNYCVITNTSIIGNDTVNLGGGIGIEQGTDINIEYCVIAGNTASLAGGIYTLNDESIQITNCTVTDNYASSNCGGLLLRENCVARNCIVAGNTTGGTGGGVCFSSGYAQFTYGDLYDNEPDECAGSLPSALGELVTVNANGDSCDVYGNIALSPQFCEPEDLDLQVAQTSPCLGAGEDGADIGALGVGCEIVAAADWGSAVPASVTLLRNYPNPFNPQTSIEFRLPEYAHVTLAVYNLIGQRIRLLVDHTMRAGANVISWDGRDAAGNAVASGPYLYRIRVDGHTQTKKMLLLK
jgi:hypothetical protein